jgi:hypothetical protein
MKTGSGSNACIDRGRGAPARFRAHPEGRPRNKCRTRRLNAFDPALQSDVSGLIEHLRTGDVDFAAEAKAAIGGTSSNIAAAAGYMSLLLMSADVDSIPVEGQPSGRVQATSPE